MLLGQQLRDRDKPLLLGSTAADIRTTPGHRSLKLRSAYRPPSDDTPARFMIITRFVSIRLNQALVIELERDIAT